MKETASTNRKRQLGSFSRKDATLRSRRKLWLLGGVLGLILLSVLSEPWPRPRAFSPPPAGGAVITVTTTVDDISANNGTVSLREAITAINAGNNLGDPDIINQNPGTFGPLDTINFNIPGAGVKTINVGTSPSAPGIPLPSINKPVIINGYSQPGSAALSSTTNATLLIELNGTAAGASASGLFINATTGGSTIKGLVINRFHASGIILFTDGNLVQGNFIGTTPNGNTAQANVFGVDVGSANNTIGGTSLSARNLISGNTTFGIAFLNSSNNNQVQGNYIGTNVFGDTAIPNGDGVLLSVGPNGNVIGGTAAGAGNLISGNTNGVHISIANDNRVQGNLIGTNASGIGPLANTNDGVLIESTNVQSALRNIVGGSTAAERNTIAYNGGTGVEVVFDNATLNAIRGNSIYSNGGLGIDLSKTLSPDGVTLNDACDADSGANNSQNFPVLTSATSGSGGTTIQGALASTANTNFLIDFYSSGGSCSGQRFLGMTSVTTDASCNAPFTVNFPGLNVQAGLQITATATTSTLAPAGDTSEFSPCITVVASSPPPLPPFPQRLYVGNNQVPGSILEYNLPLTSGSTPNFAIPTTNGVLSVGVDSNGNLAAGGFGGINFFQAPLTAASSPSATFVSSSTFNSAISTTFVTSGPQLNQLWSANGFNEIDRFVPPFSNATTSAQQTLFPGGSGVFGIAFDSSLNMYVTNASSSSNIYVFAPPYNNPPTVVTAAIPNTLYRKDAVSGAQLFVAASGTGLGRIDVYNLPLTNASAPAFSIAGSAANGINIPEAVAFDSVGNLYVGNLAARTITVYPPPFSAASLPLVTLNLPAGFAVFGIATSPPPPTFSINDVSVTEVNGGTVNATFTVTLSQPISTTATVDFETADGSATAPADYQSVNGTLTFPSGVTTRTITVPVNGDSAPESGDESHFAESFFVNLSNPTNATILKAQGVGTINDGDVTSTLQFASPFASVNETAGSVTLSVTRAGDASSATSIHFETSDGGALQKNKYTFEAGTLQWAPGDSAPKTITIPIVNEALVEGNQAFLVKLSNPTGTAAIGLPEIATVTIVDDDTIVGPANPIDDANFFVRQQYLDFLGREPDPSGLSFWTGQITACGSNATCVSNARINVSAAFFLSIEFQETGGNVLRTQRVAFSRQSNDPTSRVPYLQFMRDSRQLGQGVIVGQPGFDTLLDANKQAYAQQIVNDPAFVTRFPIQPAAQYVDSLYASAAVTPTVAERNAAISAFGAGGTLGRVAALRSVADSNSVRQAELNSSFVLAEYYGYLRRNPTDAPDFNDVGYQFWLNKLNFFNGNYIAAEMVKAFITSFEYRQRFGP